MSKDLWSFIWRPQSLYIPWGHLQWHRVMLFRVWVMCVSWLHLRRSLFAPLCRGSLILILRRRFSCVSVRRRCYWRESFLRIWEPLMSITSIITKQRVQRVQRVQTNIRPFLVRKGKPSLTLGPQISRGTVLSWMIYLIDFFVSIFYFIHSRLLMLEC